MTSLEKAKAFASRATKSTALKVAPLAMAAVSASAVPTFVESGLGCFVDSGPPHTLSTSPLAETNGVVGIALQGACLGSSSGGFGDVTAIANGFITGSGSLGPTVPIEFSFDLIGTQPFHTIGWILNIGIGSSGGSFFASGSGTDGQSFSGSGLANVLSGFSWGIDLTLSCFSPSGCGSGMGVDFGTTSVNINPPSSATVPEPSTFSLMGAAGLLLAGLRRRWSRSRRKE